MTINIGKQILFQFLLELNKGVKRATVCIHLKMSVIDAERHQWKQFNCKREMEIQNLILYSINYSKALLNHAEFLAGGVDIRRKNLK
jgi:hypothetical protein